MGDRGLYGGAEKGDMEREEGIWGGRVKSGVELGGEYWGRGGEEGEGEGWG